MHLDITKMSSKGQVVIPLHIRNKVKMEEGECLAIFEENDLIVLKKIPAPWNKNDLKALEYVKNSSSSNKEPIHERSLQRNYIH